MNPDQLPEESLPERNFFIHYQPMCRHPEIIKRDLSLTTLKKIHGKGDIIFEIAQNSQGHIYIFCELPQDERYALTPGAKDWMTLWAFSDCWGLATSGQMTWYERSRIDDILKFCPSSARGRDLFGQLEEADLAYIKNILGIVSNSGK